jgi:acetolactate synthase regulatory subunit
MQLLAISVYSEAGDRRDVRLVPGELNVVTGVSSSGKSALLDIVEYGLGRDTLVTPVGPISQTVAWYGLLLEHGATRVFVGRPAPHEGRQGTQRAMIEVGGAELDLPDSGQLVVNADTGTLREQIGRLIGIDENAGDPGIGGMAAGLEANLGHAAFLCLQSQGEIANREFLFHRQGEDAIAPSIRETLPYFLGAMPADQAVRRQQLLAAKRDLRRAETELERAMRAEEDIDVGLLAMVHEAVAAGLIEGSDLLTRSEMREALQRAVEQTAAAPEASDDVTAARRAELARERENLRAALRAAGEQAGLLRVLGSDENDYATAVGQQISRLASIELLGDEAGGASSCPACGTQLPEGDATVDEMRGVAAELSRQLESVEQIRPRRREAAEQLAADTERLREQLRATDEAMTALDATGRTVAHQQSAIELQAFTRGRIQHFLDTNQDAAAEQLARLRRVVEVRGRAVRSLEAALDPDAMREELAARLTVVGTDMTAMAQRLELEHSGAVWLDVKRLTVMVDSPQGAVPLFRVGSAANWIGAHLVAHLALHRYFVRHHRPVPRFLMLDQPTQAYYPSDMEQEEGVPDSQDDREAVRRMFALMRDFCQELSPDFQIIVCDHANLPDDWFQDAVRYNWRGGEKLIPASWL